MSHIVKVKVEYRNLLALEAAVKRLGGRWLGRVDQQFYASSTQGLGFQLPGWKYPCVLQADGKLAYDNFSGAWGDPKTLDRLREAYTVEAAKAAAVDAGYTVIDQGGNVELHTPDGGVLEIAADGTLSTHGFSGGDCETAAAPIRDALGSVDAVHHTAEYYEQHGAVEELEP